MRAVRIAGAAVQRATSDGSVVNTAIPNTDDGIFPDYVLLTCSGAPMLVKPVLSGDASTSTTLQILSEMAELLLNVRGFTHIRNGRATLTNATLSITPVDLAGPRG